MARAASAAEFSICLLYLSLSEMAQAQATLRSGPSGAPVSIEPWDRAQPLSRPVSASP